MSGAFADVGESEVRSYRYAIDWVNAQGSVQSGTRLELATFDSKGNPEDALVTLKQVIDQGSRVSNATVDT